MKAILKITVALLVSTSFIYSQKAVDNTKGLKLKLDEPQAFEKNGKTYWSVNATLSNSTKDTIYYFDNKGSEAGSYIVSASADTIVLTIDFAPKFDQTLYISALPPKGKQTVKLEITSAKPVNTSFGIVAYLWVRKAMNRKETATQDELNSRKYGDHGIFLPSNEVKVKAVTPKK
jgi:hypothetical protein